MPFCELCGKETDLVVADIEGVELKVCANCGKHGKVKRRIEPPRIKPGPILTEMPELTLVENFSSLLRSAREKRNMTQEEFAKFLNGRESMIPKWESGQLKPDIETAQKIGRKLGINLIEKEEIMPAKIEHSKVGEITFGDMVRIRKRK